MNTLTPQNIKKVSEQVLAVKIDGVDTLEGLVSQIFEKALMEPISCEMYAKLCYHLADALPVLCQYTNGISFKTLTLLVNKCQKEFQRMGEREQANKSNEEREEKQSKAKRCMVGNIRFAA